MFWKRIFRVEFLIVLGLALCVSPAVGQEGSGPEEPLTDGQAQNVAPVAGGPGYVMLPAVAFQPSINGQIYDRAYGVKLATLAGSSGYYYYAPLALPDRARLKKLVMYYKDSDPSGQIRLRFYRAELPFAGTSDDIARINSTDGATYAYMETATITTHSIVDNQAYAYYVQIELPVASSTSYELLFNGIRVDYEYTSSLPAVSR